MKIIRFLKVLFCKHELSINGFIGMYQCQKCSKIPKFVRNKLVQEYSESLISNKLEEDK